MALINITGDGNNPVSINQGHAFSVAVSGTLDGTIKVQYPTAGPAAAALTTSLSGSNNDLVFTAVNAGTAGNSLTVAYEDPSASDTALSAAFTHPDLVITLATDSGDPASVVLNPTGDNNNIEVTANADGASGNNYSVELLDPSANDADILVSTVDNLKYTVSLATGGAGAITSTAQDVIDALNAYAPFAALMTADNHAGNDGTGTVEAIAETSLSGGGDNYSITTTAAQIGLLVNADNTLSRFFSVANASSNNGTGVVTALSETALSGGTAGTFTDYDGGDTGDFTATGERIFVNVGAADVVNLATSGTSSTDADVIVVDLGRYAG